MIHNVRLHQPRDLMHFTRC